MATVSALSEAHSTLTGSTVETVNLTNGGSRVTVFNRSGAAEIYFTYSAGGTAATPTVGGAETFVLPAAVCSFSLSFSGATAIQVKLISSGTPTYSVEAV